MNGEPDSIASVILASPDTISKLRKLAPSDLYVELWHIVAEIASTRHQEIPVASPVPDIRKLIDAVLPMIVAAFGKGADTASTA